MANVGDPEGKEILFCFGFLIIGFATNSWFKVFLGFWLHREFPCLWRHRKDHGNA